MKIILLFLSFSLFIAGCASKSKNSENLNTEAEKINYSPQALKGEKLFASCLACHNPELDPPLGAPMFGVQRRYMRAYGNKEEFTNAVVDFVLHPTEEKAMMREAVQELKLMPAFALPEQDVRNIATYIYETTFKPPCKHWEIEIRNSSEDASGHIRNIKNMFAKHCSD